MAADPPALRQLAVRRTARYLTMGVPSPATRELWYVCHGYGQLAAEFIRDFAVLDDDSRLVVAPEALNRFYKNPEPSRHRIGGVGATWMTSEARELEIDDYVAYLDDLHAHLTADAVAGGADPDSLRVRVLGFSQGAATAARWVALGRVRAHELVLWGGLMPPDLSEEARRRLVGVPLTVVYGARDQYATPKVLGDEEARLERLGFRPRRVIFDGGHRMDDDTLRALAAQSPAP
jgi:predicted esterase